MKDVVVGCWRSSPTTADFTERKKQEEEVEFKDINVLMIHNVTS